MRVRFSKLRMTDKIIIVTGASGYIASRLIPRLLERGHAVRAMVRTPGQLDGGPGPVMWSWRAPT
jgi:uncharacterized protein YbjT (DUF2867 family)